MIVEDGENSMTVQTLERKLKPFEYPLESQFSKWLYLHLPPQPIENKKMHEKYADVVTILMQELESGTIPSSDRIFVEKYLKSVIPFITEYEENEFKPKSLTPEDMLCFLMEQNGLNQYDIAEDLGGQPVVSEILNGRRKLTRDHIERLSKRFHISPATFY